MASARSEPDAPGLIGPGTGGPGTGGPGTGGPGTGGESFARAVGLGGEAPRPGAASGSLPAAGTAEGAVPDPLAIFKILIAGGFGVGKTTLVGSISEVRPLRTEEALTSASVGFDDLTGVGGKTTTTVAMDFGRLTLGGRVVLYLFGTPGQERFWFMWDDLAYGALGAVVLADTRRLSDCFPAVDYFEKRQLPFVVAINRFDGAPQYDPEDVRIALDLDPRVPAMLCDARQLDSVRQVLITLVEHVLTGVPR